MTQSSDDDVPLPERDAAFTAMVKIKLAVALDESLLSVACLPVDPGTRPGDGEEKRPGRPQLWQNLVQDLFTTERLGFAGSSLEPFLSGRFS